MTSALLLSREYCHKTEAMSSEYYYLTTLLYVNLIKLVITQKFPQKKLYMLTPI